jgi:Uma2 family endonuclease
MYSFLLIEVADSSLAYDRDFKLPMYARAEIAEAWIVNRPENRIEVYRRPVAGNYAEFATFQRGTRLVPNAFPDIEVPVDAILG